MTFPSLYLQSEDPALQIPVTSPFQSSGSTTACRGRQRRRTRPPTPPARTVLYCSLLRQEPAAGGDEVRGARYTPPPMLCPLRAGPGLYCSLTSRRQQRVQTVQLQNSHGNQLKLTDPTHKQKFSLSAVWRPPLVEISRCRTSAYSAGIKQ